MPAPLASPRALLDRLRPLPGSGRVHEARWALRVRRAPVLTVEEHVRRVGVSEIEEAIGCSLCGEQRVQPLLRPRGKDGRWSYHVVRCPVCGFLYRDPGIRPDRLGELYADAGYSRFLTGRYGAARQRRYRTVMDRFAPLFAEGGGRRLLDFGCGAGLFLEVAHDRGFDGYGVDLSRDSVEQARRRPGGANAFFGTPQEVPEIAGGGFDVITMWSVLAHLPCPVEDLTMMRELLAPGGLLLILTVNANSRMLKSRGEAWNGFTPNHLKFYSPATLPLLLRRAGFGAVAMKPLHEPAPGASEAQRRRAARAVERGNQGNMLCAVAFADPHGPLRLDDGDVLRL